MNYVKNEFFKNTLLPFVMVLCGSLVLTGCNDDDDVTPIDDVETAYVSLYQASPDAPDMRIVVDSRQINTYPFDYSENTGYLRFYAGERTLSFGPYDGSNIVADTTVTFEDDGIYSVFVTDEYPDVEPLILEDDAQTPEEGMAMIRFLHLSPDAPAVSLNAENMEDPLFDSQDFREASSFMSVSSGTYDLNVQTVDGSETVLEIPDATFQEGWFYTIIVRGYASPPAGNDNDLTADIIIN